MNPERLPNLELTYPPTATALEISTDLAGSAVAEYIPPHFHYYSPRESHVILLNQKATSLDNQIAFWQENRDYFQTATFAAEHQDLVTQYLALFTGLEPTHHSVALWKKVNLTHEHIHRFQQLRFQAIRALKSTARDISSIASRLSKEDRISLMYAVKNVQLWTEVQAYLEQYQGLSEEELQPAAELFLSSVALLFPLLAMPEADQPEPLQRLQDFHISPQIADEVTAAHKVRLVYFVLIAQDVNLLNKIQTQQVDVLALKKLLQAQLEKVVAQPLLFLKEMLKPEFRLAVDQQLQRAVQKLFK